MYSLVDRPTDHLTDGSRFLLQAMRIWTAAAEQNRCPTVTLAASFARFGALEVLNDFHALMLICSQPSLTLSGARLADRGLIDEREAVLLALWSDIVADRFEQVRAVLALVVDKPSVGLAVANLVRVAAHLSSLDLAPAGLRRGLTEIRPSRRRA
jgi:hypothetical protein